MTDLEAQAVGCRGSCGRGPHYTPDLRTFHLNSQVKVQEQEKVQVLVSAQMQGPT